MKPFILKLLGGLKYALFGLVVAAAILVLLLRLYLPFIDQHKSYIADALSAYLNTPVDLQHLQARLHGFGLIIDVQGLQLGDKAHPIKLGQATLKLDYRRFHFHLTGLQLKLIRQSNGELAWHGLPFLQSSGQSIDLPPIAVVLSETTLIWHDQKFQAAPIAINGVQLVIHQSANQIKLHGEFDNQLGKLAFAAQARPDLSQGKSYVDWQGMPLASLASPYLLDGYQLQSGRLDSKVWQHWEAGIPTAIKARFAIKNIQPEGFTRAHHLQAKLDVSVQPNGTWHLGVTDVSLDEKSDAIGAISVQKASTGQLNAALAYLELQPILDFVKDHPGLLGVKQALLGLNPTGRLQDIRATMDLPDRVETAAWMLNAAFKDVSVSAWEQFPAVKGLQGRVAIQPDKMSMQLQLQSQQLDYAELFDRPIDIRQVSTDLYAMLDEPDTWRIQADQFKLNTVDFSSNGLFRLHLIDGKVAHLDGQLHIDRLPAKQLKHYVPAKLVEPELTEWLNTAFLQGNLEPVRMLFSGPLDTFPYHETRNGTFEVIGKVRDIKLKYQKGWPVMAVDEGLVHFYQNSLDAKLFSGGLYNSSITGQAHIESLDPTSALIAKGEGRGPLQDVLTILKEDALKANFGHIADLMRIKGDGNTKLNLSVPLVTGRSELSVQGRMKFARNQLHLNKMNLTAKQLRGELALDQTQIRAKNLKASVFGTPIKVNIQPQSGNNQIKVAGRFKPDLIKRFKPGLALGFIKGDALTQLTLTLPGLRSSGKKARTTLSVESDLRGLQIDLPKPLVKSAQAKRELKLEMVLSDQTVPIKLAYGKSLQAIFTQDGKKADLRYTSGKPKLPQQGYSLDAKFDALNLADWQHFIQTLPANKSHSQPWKARLSANQLDYKDVHLSKVTLLAEQDNVSLRGQLDSEQIKGNFFYPQNTQKPEPLSVHLKKAHITWAKSEGRQPVPTEFGPDPRNMPALRLICEDLRVNQMSLGQLVLDSHKTDQGLHINKLLVAGRHLSFNSQGSWLMQTARPKTRLQGKFHANDLGDFLDAMGFQRNVHQADTNLLFDLNWPGHPVQVRKETVAGSANLSIGQGRLSELEPGLIKVLGLLNLDVIGRRLQLNFDDLLQKGYSFDKIEGDFTLASGNANTRNLQVLGPTSHIQMGGRIGYIERDFDAHVYVTPELDGTLLLAGVLAGGPVVGLGTLLVQQLLNDAVNDLSRFEYSVTGSWDEPQLNSLEEDGTDSPAGEKNNPIIEPQAIITPETDKQGFLRRLLEKIRSGEVDQELLDDPQFEEVD